jgi:NitT/TauT family transport system ATP-binding protein
MTSKLVISDLSKRFGDLEVLRNIDLEIERGAFISVVGPSGCGKTTFLRIVAGLELATSGEVLLDGRAVHRPGGDRGFVFQSDNLLPWRTVISNAMIGPEVAGHNGPAERRRTLDLLKLVGLAGFEDYYPSRVSGGMRQRAAIARALAIEPDLLLMDEPFGSLDAQNRRIMQNEVRRIWRETGRTILFVTHAIEEAVAIGTTLIMLSARPSRIRTLVRNDGRVERSKLIDDLNTMIMEEVERQQGAGS